MFWISFCCKEDVINMSLSLSCIHFLTTWITWFFGDYLDLLLSIGGMVCCALPFTTNVTISTSISQTFRSWVVIFHHRQPLAFFYITANTVCSSYECFILKAARLSSKLLGQGYVGERLKSSLRKFYGRYGDLIKHYKINLSNILHDILGHDHIQLQPPIDQILHEFVNLFPNWPYYKFSGGFHRTIAAGAASQQKTFTPPDIWSCPICDLHLFLGWDYFLLSFSCFRTLNFEYPSVLQVCFFCRTKHNLHVYSGHEKQTWIFMCTLLIK